MLIPLGFRLRATYIEMCKKEKKKNEEEWDLVCVCVHNHVCCFKGSQTFEQLDLFTRETQRSSSLSGVVPTLGKWIKVFFSPPSHGTKTNLACVYKATCDFQACPQAIQKIVLGRLQRRERLCPWARHAASVAQTLRETDALEGHGPSGQACALRYWRF